MTDLIVSLETCEVGHVLVRGETAVITAAGAEITAIDARPQFIPITVLPSPSIVEADVPNGVSRDRLRWVNGALVVLDPPPVPTVPVPQSVTPLQARKALRTSGLIDDVEAYIATQSAAIQDEWEYAVQIERNNPAIAAAGPALGLTDAQIDDLFRLAATL